MTDDTSWLPLTTDDEIAALQELLCDFHDGCLREVHLSFGTHLGADGDTLMDYRRALTVHLLIQLPANIFARPRAVELRFEDGAGVFFDACPVDYDPRIMSASIVQRDGVYYWCLNPDDLGSRRSAWVGGRRLSWRPQDTWIGDTPRYGPAAP